MRHMIHMIDNYHKKHPNSGDCNAAPIFGAPRLASPSPAVDPFLSASDGAPFVAVAGK